MKVLELFAGYGSQALALENLGIDFTSDISEIDKYAIDAYNQLHGYTKNWGDITKIDETKLPYYDLITYSFPCQDISLAGLQKGLDKDSETRSSLLWECERIIRAVKPKYLLMENVKNLVGEKHKPNFIRWLRVLEMMGYQNYWQVLNAKDYGVPQNRERVFVVSILGFEQYLFPNPIKLEKRLKDVLEHDVDEKYYLSDKLIAGFLRKASNPDDGFGKNGINVRDENGTASCLTARMAKCGIGDNYIQDTPKVDFMGNCLYPGKNYGTNFAGATYGTDGLSPTLNTYQGGNRTPYIQEPLALDEQNDYIRTDGIVGTLTTDGSSPKHNNRVIEPKVVQVGNIVNTGNWDNPQRGRIYSDKGCCPALNTAQGGGLEPKIVTYDIPQTVTVRKHNIDTAELIKALRESKAKSNVSNIQIAERLNLPLTKVEHWFRTDNSFAIPDKDVWFKLKEIINLTSDEYDAFVTEFEEKDGVFEKANRCYGTDGIAPTMTSTSADEKILTIGNYMPSGHSAAKIVNNNGLAPTVMENHGTVTATYQNYRIRKLTPRECWRLMGVKDEQFDKISGISNSQLYKLAGNSIVVDVLMGIFKNLLLSDEGTNGQLTLF